MLDDLRAGFFDRHVGGQRKDSLARGHDLANRNVVEFDCAMNERFLKAREETEPPRSRCDQLEFFGRVNGGALGHRNIEAAKNDGCRPFEQSHGGTRHLHEDEHGRGDRYCQGFGTA